MMVGATTVQFCTAVMVYGYGLLSETLKGMADFLDRKGYSSVREIIGVANEDVVPYSEIIRLPREQYRVDEEKCIQCGACVEACFYGAIALEGNQPEITEKCVGCSFCRSFCPEKAIVLVAGN
jgi:NAD-dependent dihydropyrimidine dehydrogenase PreA subunit